MGTNPLNPQYKLQSVTYLPPDPMRFIRDPMTIDDIEGARPSKKKHNDVITRDNMKISDIEGAKPRLGH